VKTLREWRVERLLSLTSLAAQAGITKKTLIDLELGRRRPHYQTIAALCQVLNVAPGEVVEFVATLDQRSHAAVRTTPRPHLDTSPPVG
jgi:transcriptional regulator with XRE-family HTH domain